MRGCAVRQAREEKGWMRHELAGRVGMDVEAVGRLEDGMDDISMLETAGYIFLLDNNETVYMDFLLDDSTRNIDSDEPVSAEKRNIKQTGNYS